MGRSPETNNFDAEQTANSVFKSVDTRYPQTISPDEARQITQDLAEGARITMHIGALAQGKLSNIARERRRRRRDR